MNRDKLAYIDTSAYLSILFGEKRGTELENSIPKNLYSSWLLYVEAKRTILRYRRQNLISDNELMILLKQFEQDCKSIAFCPLDKWIERIPLPSGVLPRSSDLVHIQTAYYLMNQYSLSSFISLDDVQIACAVELGFEVIS